MPRRQWLRLEDTTVERTFAARYSSKIYHRSENLITYRIGSLIAVVGIETRVE